MAQLRQDYDEYLNKGAEIVVVGPESQKAFKRYWTEHNLPFIGLADPSHKVLKSYGQEIKIFKLGRMPAQAIIDSSGRVRFIHYGHSMSDIPSNAEILGLLDSLSIEK